MNSMYKYVEFYHTYTCNIHPNIYLVAPTYMLEYQYPKSDI